MGSSLGNNHFFRCIEFTIGIDGNFNCLGEILLDHAAGTCFIVRVISLIDTLYSFFRTPGADFIYNHTDLIATSAAGWIA